MMTNRLLRGLRFWGRQRDWVVLIVLIKLMKLVMIKSSLSSSTLSSSSSSSSFSSWWWPTLSLLMMISWGASQPLLASPAFTLLLTFSDIIFITGSARVKLRGVPNQRGQKGSISSLKFTTCAAEAAWSKKENFQKKHFGISVENADFPLSKN